ncbi:MAG: tRNA (adenosine(37)-N6)-threonylcarbamoyltransferase complex ATPase subunit type 1 TsaE [Gammaproteobacteria bacterium]|nr:MAG: tRNA (adenosine(37)-N6)-threonylcarbamoyltransferase complex ATPase subunit type 1 TsaE [Gammaproteobacteria bacterium]
MSLIKYLATEEEVLQFAAQIAKAIPDGAILFLHGPLGAGKTTFTRGFLRGLGFQHKVKSPTYTLVEPYDIAGRPIFHFDFYRLRDAQELEHIGIHEYFFPSSICLIEWAEKGMPLLPVADLDCYIEVMETGRKMRIEAASERGRAILGSLL